MKYKVGFWILVMVSLCMGITSCSASHHQVYDRDKCKIKLSEDEYEKILPSNVFYSCISGFVSTIGYNGKFFTFDYVYMIGILDAGGNPHIYTTPMKIIPNEISELFKNEYGTDMYYAQIYPELRRMTLKEIEKYEFYKLIILSNQPCYEFCRSGYEVTFDSDEVNVTRKNRKE